jgi:uncharacterized repeat protein (TIGR01451 family)
MKRHIRLTTALGAVTLLSGAGLGIGITPAAAAPASGSYTGNGSADLVHLNAANITGVVNLADATVAPATSVVSTSTSPRVTSHATNANVQLLSAAINQNLVVDAKQTAPPDHATGVHSELLTVPAAPVLTAQVTTADAHSRWHADDSCVTSGQISSSISKVADARVLPASPLGGDLVSLTNNSDPSGAAVSQTTVGLVKPTGLSNYGVRSTSLTQVTAVNLLGQLVVNVINSPKVTATATGVPGKSTVALVQPVVNINGTTYVSGQTLAPIRIPAGPVLDLTIGKLTKSISADGTVASGSGQLLRLKVLDVTGTITLADLSIGDVSARATAPSGGVVCTPLTPNPLRDARKDSSVATVNAGETFDYTITIPNRGNADLTNVVVLDTVSGSPALALVSSVPTAVAHHGSTYAFALGTIAPNQVKTIVMTFKVPSGTSTGTKYSNKAVITATYGGKPITKTVTTPYPTVDGAGGGGCDLGRSNKFASHTKVKRGETFTYYINAFNQGGQPCTGVIIKDALNSGVKFVSCTHGCSRSGQLLTWDVGTIQPGASMQLAITVKVLASSGTLPNAADITPDSGRAGSPSTPGPTVTNISVLGPTEPATRGPGPGQFRTGGMPLLAALVTGLMVVGTRRKLLQG